MSPNQLGSVQLLPELLLPELLPEPLPELLPPLDDELEVLFDELLHAVIALTEAHPEATIAVTARLTLASCFMARSPCWSDVLAPGDSGGDRRGRHQVVFDWYGNGATLVRFSPEMQASGGAHDRSRSRAPTPW
jgi:hypothetical protein